MINFSIELLPDKNKRHKRKHEHRNNIHILHRIEDRPKIINTRHTFGNWEVDTVSSYRSESKSCLATFVERKTRFTWVIKIPNRTNFEHVSNEQITEAIDLINNKSLKVLLWKSAI